MTYQRCYSYCSNYNGSLSPKACRRIPQLLDFKKGVLKIKVCDDFKLDENIHDDFISKRMLYLIRGSLFTFCEECKKMVYVEFFAYEKSTKIKCMGCNTIETITVNPCVEYKGNNSNE